MARVDIAEAAALGRRRALGAQLRCWRVTCTKLILPLLLIGHPVWAERLPLPPVPPTRSSPVRLAKVPHRGSSSSAKAVLPRGAPKREIPSASAQQATAAPMPDRDAWRPPDPNSSPHTQVTPTDFRP